MRQKMRDAAISRTKDAVEQSRKTTRLEIVKLVVSFAEKLCVLSQRDGSRLCARGVAAAAAAAAAA
jgi:hypothetical protein